MWLIREKATGRPRQLREGTGCTTAAQVLMQTYGEVASSVYTCTQVGAVAKADETLKALADTHAAELARALNESAGLPTPEAPFDPAWSKPL